MLVLKPSFYIILLTVHIVFSYDNGSTFLTKVVDKIYIYSKQNPTYSHLSRIKMQNNLRRYNISNIKEGDKSIGYPTFYKPYNLITHNYDEKIFPVNFRKFFDKRYSFVYNEMKQNSGSSDRHKSKIFFMGCNYPKTRLKCTLCNKYLIAHFSKVTPFKFINSTVIKELIIRHGMHWNKNIITVNGLKGVVKSLCLNVPNVLSSIKTNKRLFHFAPYAYPITCCFFNNYSPQRKHSSPLAGGRIFRALSSKSTFPRTNIYQRKILVEYMNKIAKINFLVLNKKFSEDKEWRKIFIKSLRFCQTNERRHNRTNSICKLLGKSESPNPNKFYNIKSLQNFKIKFPPVFSRCHMSRHHLPSFHKMNKRSVDVSYENNTRSYSSIDSLNTDDAENAFPNSLESINPMKRRGEDGVIYIHGLFEMSDGECREYPQTGRFEYEAAQLAIQHVNEKNVIDGYQLKMYYNDTKCDSGVAVDAFFHSLYRQPTMSVILGTGSSEVTERLARVVSRWNVMQMSYGATSPALSDRENFPLFFRTVAPDSSHNAALLAFVLHHKWLTVAALHEQGDKHALPMTKLVTDLEQVNVTVKVTKGTSERDYKDHLQELKDQDCRIVICSFSSSLFRKIFCQVYHLGMHGAEYAWIILGDTTDSWKGDASGTECNDHQLITAIQGVISVGSHYEAVGNGTAISEMTITEILDAIRYKQNYRSTGFISQTYDAVWAIALTFQNVEQNWRSHNSSSTLGQFTYDKHTMAQDFSTTMANLRFMGVSGPVSFYNSDRVGITAFHQKQGKIMKLAAIYNPDEARLDFQCAGCSGLVWQGGSPPISSRIIIRRIATLDRRVFICVTALAALGVTLALTFLSFNLYYRKLKFIKLSSPNLNNFVVVGCVLVYIAVILLGVDHGTLISDDHFPVICSARAFLLSGGFSLAFGCMFIKTYRVYHIFIRTNTGIVKSKLLHDQQLLGMVSVLLLVDCVLVTLWVTVDPMERQLTHLSLQVNREERNVGYLYLREHCNSAHMAKWLGSLYIYKGLLLVVGCYMAWETRHVKVPALNDSQYIGMSVYNVVITSIIVVALANVIPADRYTLTFVLVSTLIFVSTTTTLCILFVPKIHTILINPEDAAVVATPGVKVECKTRRFALDEPRESLYRAEVQNRALKRELIELDQEYNRLAEKVGFTPCALRKPRLSDNQDEDSDDGLPPWLADYKDYSSAANEDVWCTSRPTIASAFNTIHSVALQLPSTSASFLREAVQNKSDYTLNNMYYTPLRASLTKIDNREDITLECSKPVRSFLSDRALNKLKIPQTLRETIFDDVEDSPIPFRNLLPSVLEKHLRSEPKLFSGIHSQSNLHFTSCPSKSLNQVSNLRDSLSDFSKNTSGASEFTTAQLYDSTSFSTPPEDFVSSSNNGHDSTKSAQRSSENTTSNYLTCDEDPAQDSREIPQSQNDVETKNNINSVVSSPENSTFHEFSSNKSDTNALSGSSSSTSAATVSDLSTDISDVSKHETSNAAVSVDDSPTRCSSSLKTVKNETQEQSQSCPQSEIRNININIGETRCTVTEVQPSNFMERTAETASNEIGAKCNMIKIDADNSSENPDNANSNENKTTPSQHNNNVTEEPERAVQIDNLRNQIFRLERELILLQLDQSDAVDL